MTIALSAVAFQDDGLWIAQCLEHDIAVSAQSITKLHHVLEKAVLSNVAVNIELGRKGLEGIPPAPDHFWKMFETGVAQIEAIDRSERSWPVQIAAMRLVELEAHR